ncbi:hypothetical protein MSG28_005725 [Choristoneura fumiferana]|uniref:Uncharacterized protein n=1 Tax=Choristoneura fumiferana TaxID=7141 RepID=A0ACC0KZS6_CHOFU|nr:hypothetical protein MSG28_005725 [Choristoneura fumiferana]
MTHFVWILCIIMIFMQGGFARLFYEIKHILDSKPDAMLLNAGDDFQGTYWFTLLKDKVMSKFINMLPNDAHTLGNHEFDDGVAGLVPYLEALRDPVLVANIDTSLEPTLNGLYKPHVVLERKGRKIAIIGVTTPDTKMLSNPEGVRFLDPAPIVKKEAQLLTDQGVDIIIVLSHCGLYVDKAMAKTVGENVDIIVGGHTHSLLWNGTAPSHEVVAGTYPEYEEADNKPGHKVLVVTASAFSKYLGYIGVDFDGNGDIVSFEAQPVFLNRSIPEDPEIKEALKPYMEKINEIVKEVVGNTSEDLSLNACSYGECALGDIIVDSFLDKAKQKNPTNSTSFSYIMKKMIRTDIKKGDITTGDIMNVQPFASVIWSYKIQGKYVKEALEESTRRSDLQASMPQVAGLKLTINTTSKEITVLVKKGDEWIPLEDDEEYQFTTPKYIKQQFEPLNANAKDISLVGIDFEIVKDYVKKITPINPLLDGRLTVIS